MKFAVVAAVLSLSATPALAQIDFTTTSKGYTYFHKPGADIAAHDADLKTCLQVARNLTTGGQSLNAAAPLLDGMHSAFAEAGNTESCMVVHGWDVRQVEDAKGAAMAGLSREARHAELAGMIGAVPGQDRRIRTFDNDLTHPGNTWQGRSWGGGGTSLSVTSLGKFDYEEPRKLRKLPKTAWPLTPLSAGQIAKLPPEASVIVVRAEAVKGRAALFQFNRVGPNPDIPGWIDGDPATFSFGPVGALGSSNDHVWVFRVKPGKWRYQGLVSVYGLTTTCLGAPAFEIKPGEALFAGNFRFGGEPQAIPDMDMAPLTTANLKDGGKLLSRLKPVSYVNGSVERCRGAYGYALEIPGAPFEGGYTLGSRARPAATTAP